jgi:hypothetical protein
MRIVPLIVSNVNGWYVLAAVAAVYVNILLAVNQFSQTTMVCVFLVRVCSIIIGDKSSIVSFQWENKWWCNRNNSSSSDDHTISPHTSITAMVYWLSLHHRFLFRSFLSVIVLGWAMRLRQIQYGSSSVSKRSVDTSIIGPTVTRYCHCTVGFCFSL